MVIILANSSKALMSQKLLELTKIFGAYNFKVGQTFSDLTKDAVILQNSDIILTNSDAWDVLTRRWKARKGFNQIGLILIDGLHLLPENYSTL